jgi:uncharacterized repeat protein (TIGR03803 family)
MKCAILDPTCERSLRAPAMSEPCNWLPALLLALALASFGSAPVRGGGLVEQALHCFGPGTAYNFIPGSGGYLYGTSATDCCDCGGLYRINPDGILTNVVAFQWINGLAPGSGQRLGSLIRGDDGNFYGISYKSVFRLTPNGSMSLLASFLAPGSPACLVQGTSGDLFGIGVSEDPNAGGNVFSIRMDGTLTTLLTFPDGTNGPNALFQSADGNLYGTTRGSFFSMTAEGVLLSLVPFKETYGITLLDSLIQGVDGNFYGVGSDQPESTNYVIFKMTRTEELTTLASLPANQANQYWGDLIAGSDHDLFWLAHSPSDGRDTIFKLATNGVLTSLAVLGTNLWPYALFQGNDGTLYGSTGAGGALSQGSLYMIRQPGGTPKTLYSFGPPEGLWPAGLAQGEDGSVYGTTASGGTGQAGTFFRITGSGAFTTLASFTPGSLDSLQLGKLVRGKDGNFYLPAAGAIVQLTPDGTLRTFTIPDPDFSNSYAAELVLGNDGNLYTQFSFTSFSSSASASEITNIFFRMTPSGHFTQLASLVHSNRLSRVNSFVLGIDLNLYVAVDPPIESDSYVPGYLARITPDGQISQLPSHVDDYLYSTHRMFLGSDGNPYLFAFLNGAVMKIAMDGTATKLASIEGSDLYPVSLTQGGDGAIYLYCVTGSGPSASGSIFRMPANGVANRLYRLNASQASAISALLPGGDGNLYGIDTSRGTGAVFRLVEPPVLSVRPQASGKATLTWNSFTNGVYQVESKPNLPGSNWTVLMPDLAATGLTTSVTDHPGIATERYYRVRLLP